MVCILVCILKFGLYFEITQPDFRDMSQIPEFTLHLRLFKVLFKTSQNFGLYFGKLWSVFGQYFRKSGLFGL